MGGARLTSAIISAEHPQQQLSALTQLSFPKRGFTEVVDISVCENLSRLDISNNSLTSIEGLALCTNLKWLSVAGNSLTSLKGVETLYNLTVLNASRNVITSMDEVSSLSTMQALILNDNEITSICKLDQLTDLNTLVLSHNPIGELGKSVQKLSLLKKLSLSYCELQSIGSSIKHNVALKELRFAHNKLTKLPQEMENNDRLEILDIGHNHIHKWSDIQVLCRLKYLRNLNLHGNPISERKKYQEKITELLPQLSILDSHPIMNFQKQKRVNASNEIVSDKNFEDQHSKDIDMPLVGSIDSSVTDMKRKKKSRGATDSLVTEKKKKKTRKDSDVDHSGVDEDKPFLEFIVSAEDDNSMRKNTSEKEQRLPVRKEKLDSGVISVLDNLKKSNACKGKSLKNIGAFLENKMHTEIGMGGPSTWDT